MSAPSLRRRRYDRAGRLVPRRLRGLRAGSVILKPGGSMPWHSTKDREELLIVLAGSVRLELAGRTGTKRRVALPADIAHGWRGRLRMPW